MKKNVGVHFMIMGLIITSSNIIQSAEESDRENISQFGAMTRAVPALADEIVHTIALDWLRTNPKVTHKDFIAYYSSPFGGNTFSRDILERAYKSLQSLRKEEIDKATAIFLQEIKNAGTTDQYIMTHGTKHLPQLKLALGKYFGLLGQFGARK